jgi:ABC-2 type transport system ATP-binding protein
MADELAIEVAGLRKAYGPVEVLRGIDLRVPCGSVFALLGPNGAGKTTMVRILSTLARADGGHARVAGFDVIRERDLVRRAISVTGQFAALDDLLTAEENLRMIGQLAGLSSTTARTRASELLEQFDLVEAARRRVGTFSGGMRRRLDLATSLVGHPRLVFLDEPTTGLDPRSRQAFWQVVHDLAGSGVTIFLTTQYLEEADQLADTIAVLDDGQIVADGAASVLKRQVGGQRLDITLRDAAAFDWATGHLRSRLISRDPIALTLTITAGANAEDARSLLDEIDPTRQLVDSFSLHDATLDDVFLTLTGRATTPESEAVNV